MEADGQEFRVILGYIASSYSLSYGKPHLQNKEIQIPLIMDRRLRPPDAPLVGYLLTPRFPQALGALTRFLITG